MSEAFPIIDGTLKLYKTTISPSGIPLYMMASSPIDAISIAQKYISDNELSEQVISAGWIVGTFIDYTEER